VVHVLGPLIYNHGLVSVNQDTQEDIVNSLKLLSKPNKPFLL